MDETCVCGTPLCCCSYLSPSVNTTVTKCPFLEYSFANAVNCVPIPPLFVGPSNSHVINAIFNVPRGGLVNFVRSRRAFASCSDADIEGNPIVNDASPPPSVFNACTTSEHKTTTTTTTTNNNIPKAKRRGKRRRRRMMNDNDDVFSRRFMMMMRACTRVMIKTRDSFLILQTRRASTSTITTAMTTNTTIHFLLGTRHDHV